MVDSVGRSGGLAMMWKSTIDVQVQSYSHWYISVVANDPVTNNEWLLTKFYGHPDAGKRTSSWNLLKTPNQRKTLPWFDFGDFNKITCQNEKQRASFKPYW